MNQGSETTTWQPTTLLYVAMMRVLQADRQCIRYYDVTREKAVVALRRFGNMAFLTSPVVHVQLAIGL